MTHRAPHPPAGEAGRPFKAIALAVGGGVAVLAGLLLLLGVVIYELGAGERQFETVRMGGETFRLELAITRAERQRGMAGRDHVAEDGGMLFVFDEPAVLWFWMKGCLIPLDIIFIDGSGRIVQTHTMPAPPP